MGGGGHAVGLASPARAARVRDDMRWRGGGLRGTYKRLSWRESCRRSNEPKCARDKDYRCMQQVD